MNDFQQRLKGAFSLFFLFVCILFLPAQGIGSWRTHLPFYDVTDVAETPNKVFGLASGSLFSYSPDDQEIKKYGKYDGLNDVGIGFIAYSEEAGALLIVYENTNADIFTNKGVYNFTGIIDKTDIDGKAVNSVNIIGKMAYISSTFGVTILDLQKKESPETYMIGHTYAACIKDQYIYVATNSGIRRGLTSRNLSSPDNWEWYDPGIEHLQTWNINKLLLFRNSMIFQQKNGPVFYKNDEGSGALSWDSFKDARLTNDQLVGIAYSSVHFWPELDKETVLSDLGLSGITGRKQGTYWIAQNAKGFGAIKKDVDSNEYSTALSNITFNSPISNYSFTVSFQLGRLFVTGGSAHANRGNRPGLIMILENGKWSHVDTDEVSRFIESQFTLEDEFKNLTFRDVTHIAVDPLNRDHFFAATYGEGLFEFVDNHPVAMYNTLNSSLETVLSPEHINQGGNNNSVRVGALAFDSNNALFITSSTEKNISVLHVLPGAVSSNFPKGEGMEKYPYWKDENFTPVSAFLITSGNNHKWLSSTRSHFLCILDDNNTYTDFSDDKTARYSSFTDQKGESISFSTIPALVQDHKGAIWMGTDKGPVIFYNPQNAIANPANFYCTRPILPYGDGTDDGYHLLESEQINAIAVDGANRKWLGTERSGAYLVSENGMEILEHFTAENSPLLSDLVRSIAIDSNTGEVFFATDKGLSSYMGDASAGKNEYSEVRAYPNPVRPEMQDVVTVINLVKDSSVKITDARGNLIYQGTSKGGMFTWKCVDNRGERVPTGMYLVFAAKPDGSEGVVTKIMVIK